MGSSQGHQPFHQGAMRLQGKACFQDSEGPHCLGSRLCLEDAWLLGERVDALASWRRSLLLQFQVQCTYELEGPVFLQLINCNRHVARHDGLTSFDFKPVLEATELHA